MISNRKGNTCTGVLDENDSETNDGGLAHDVTILKVAGERPLELYYINITMALVGHTFGVYGIWLIITSANVYTSVFALVLHILSIIGVMAGAHRLWSHRAYKARNALKVFLALTSVIAYQKSAFEWARDHRVHHKFSETNADPMNAKRGFFFAHFGCNYIRFLLNRDNIFLVILLIDFYFQGHCAKSIPTL